MNEADTKMIDPVNNQMKWKKESVLFTWGMMKCWFFIGPKKIPQGNPIFQSTIWATEHRLKSGASATFQWFKIIMEAVITHAIITGNSHFDIFGIWDLSPNKHRSGDKGIAELNYPPRTSISLTPMVWWRYSSSSRFPFPFIATVTRHFGFGFLHVHVEVVCVGAECKRRYRNLVVPHEFGEWCFFCISKTKNKTRSARNRLNHVYLH